MSKYTGFSTLHEMLRDDGSLDRVILRATKRANLLDTQDFLLKSFPDGVVLDRKVAGEGKLPND